MRTVPDERALPAPDTGTTLGRAADCSSLTLWIQATGVEQGYNTSVRPLQFDENKSPVFTRSLQLSESPDVTIDGVSYHEFLLDINQSSSNPLLSLDELRVYTSNSARLSGYS